MCPIKPAENTQRNNYYTTDFLFYLMDLLYNCVMHQYVQHKQFTSHSYLKKVTRNQNSNINYKYTEQINHPNLFFQPLKTKRCQLKAVELKIVSGFTQLTYIRLNKWTSLSTGWISGCFSPLTPFRESPSILDGVFLKVKVKPINYASRVNYKAPAEGMI